MAYDVIVVGSGAGGAAAAYGLSKSGLNVLILEAGPSYSPTDYRLSRTDWERTEFPEKVPTHDRQTYAPLQKLDKANDDLRSWNHKTGRYVSSDRRYRSGYLHAVGVGGSTLRFTGEAHRLNPRSMRLDSDYHVGADWPITYGDLEPYYSEAESIIGIAGPETSHRCPREKNSLLPAHPLSFASKTLRSGCAKLGMTLEANTLAALSRPMHNRPACNYCGQCHRGCPRGDKGSADVTFIPLALGSGRCEIRTGCQVSRINTDEKDRVTHIEFVGDSGKRQSVTATTFVIACGAVETPRLLLNSKGRYSPKGLGNESGQVGRNFMETLYWISSGLHPEALGSHRGLPSDAICWDYNNPNSIPGVIGGCRFSASTGEVNLAGPIAYANRVVKGWGKPHKKAMRKTFGHVLSIGAMGEHLPNERTYIDLDPVIQDAQGMPKARIHSYLTRDDLKRLRFMRDTCRDILKASGVPEIFEEVGAYDYMSATHVFGTCRMGADPSASVVDRWCNSHRWKNLFITDASVFPSSGGGESPSLTIEALALRTAQYIVDNHRGKSQ